MDCLRAGRRAAKCSRTLATGSAVSSKQASKKYDLKNLCSQKRLWLAVFDRSAQTLGGQLNGSVCSFGR